MRRYRKRIPSLRGIALLVAVAGALVLIPGRATPEEGDSLTAVPVPEDDVRPGANGTAGSGGTAGQTKLDVTHTPTTLADFLANYCAGHTLDSAFQLLELDPSAAGTALGAPSWGAGHTFTSYDLTISLSVNKEAGTLQYFQRMGSDKTESKERVDASSSLDERIANARKKAFGLLDALQIPPKTPLPDIDYRMQQAKVRNNETFWRMDIPIMWREAICARVVVSISLSSGQVLCYQHTPILVPARTEVRLTSDEAKNIASNFFAERCWFWWYWDSDVVLGVVQPNHWWDKDTRKSTGRLGTASDAPVLCWCVTFLESRRSGRILIAYVDAETGEIVGGSER
jgi:hypothetical protein